MQILLELLDKALQDPDIKESKPAANRIAHLLFKQKAGPVTDKKRSKLPIFWGVAHEESTVLNQKGDKIKLTFDNSTDSHEFEINSLSPLSIEKGSELDDEIKALYGKHKVRSSKKTNYTLRGGKTVMREVHLGVVLGDHAVDLVRDLCELIRSDLSRETGTK